MSPEPITPPVFLRLYREADKPETIDDFVAIYDMQVLLGIAKPTETCLQSSGCYFREKNDCGFLPSERSPDAFSDCATIFDNEQTPAIFVLRSEYEKTLTDNQEGPDDG